MAHYSVMFDETTGDVVIKSGIILVDVLKKDREVLIRNLDKAIENAMDKRHDETLKRRKK